MMPGLLNFKFPPSVNNINIYSIGVYHQIFKYQKLIYLVKMTSINKFCLNFSYKFFFNI